MKECDEQELVRNSGRIATALERIATIGEAALALAMQHTNMQVDELNDLVSKLKKSTAALKAAESSDTAEKG